MRPDILYMKGADPYYSPSGTLISPDINPLRNGLGYDFQGCKGAHTIVKMLWNRPKGARFFVRKA